MKKVLVTGGCGFIGSHVVDNLILQNYDVIVIDNLSTGKISNLDSKNKVIFYNQDITKDVSNVFEKEKPEIVIHMAAQVMLRKSLEEPLFDASVNILGTLNVLENCRKFDVKKLIYTSTGGARVGEPEYLPVDEKHPLNPCSPYGISKHTAEHYVWVYNKLYNLDYLIFCFGNVYGPRDDPSSKRVTSLFIDKILKGEVPQIFGNGEQTRDFIYVKDLAEFIVKSFEKNPEYKLFHLANGEQISVNYIVKCLKEISGKDFSVDYKKAVNGEVRDICLDTRLAETHLGWKPKRSFEEGLKETYNWFVKNHQL